MAYKPCLLNFTIQWCTMINAESVRGKLGINRRKLLDLLIKRRLKIFVWTMALQHGGIQSVLDCENVGYIMFCC